MRMDILRAQLGNYLLNYSSELGGKNINPDLFKKLISNEHDARSPYGIHSFFVIMGNSCLTPINFLIILNLPMRICEDSLF